MAPFKAYQPMQFRGPEICFVNVHGNLEFSEDPPKQLQAPKSASPEPLMEEEVSREPAKDDASSESTDAESQQEPPSNGTYSESLTRLQTGYLHAIGVLEERLKRQQQELDFAHADLQHMDFLKHQNRQLTLDLNASRSLAQEMRSAPLEKKLAEKNATLKVKNKKIADLEQTIRCHQAEQSEQIKKRLCVGATTTRTTVQGATPAAARKSDFGAKGDYEKSAGPTQQTNYEAALKREPTSYDCKNIGATEGGNAAKKRKLNDLTRAQEDGGSNEDVGADQVVRGSKANPFVID